MAPPTAQTLLTTPGELIRLKHCASGKYDKLAFLVVPKPDNQVVLRMVLQNSPGSLRSLPTGHIDLNGGEGRWATYRVEYFPDNTIALRNVGNEGKANRNGSVGWYLGLTADGEVAGDLDNGPYSRWRVSPLDAAERAFCASYLDHSSVVDRPMWCPEADLTREQRQHFMQHGFLHIPGVVPAALIDDALRAINHQLLQPESMKFNEQGHLVLAGNVQHSREILMLLYQSPAFTLAQRLIGRDKVTKPRGGQAALRAPENSPPSPMGGKSWHVDGLEKEHHSAFTLLLGVTLSDCTLEDAGNFTIWPGSHHVLASDMNHVVHNGMPPSTLMRQDCKRDFGKPFQVKARKGDVVLAHHKLAHRGGANYSPNIRYQVYFRLNHIKHSDLEMQALTDPFLEFEGLRDLVPAPAAPTPGWEPIPTQAIHNLDLASAPAPAPYQPSPAVAPYQPSPAVAPAPMPAPIPTYPSVPTQQRPVQPPAAVPVPQPPASSTSLTALTPEQRDKVQQLVLMGFTADAAARALQTARGDMSRAIDLLVGQ